MAGLIDQMQPGGAEPVSVGGDKMAETVSPKGNEPAEGGDALSPEKISAQIKMPPELQQAYERVVIAGMKVMFDPKTHEMAVKMLQGEGPISERLGGGIASLMVLLFKQSNQTMPPQVMVPAGTDLLIRAADFLRKSGTEQMTDQDIGEALSVMVEKLLTAFGMDPAKVLNSFDASAVPQGGLVDQAAPQPAGEVESPAEEASPGEEPDQAAAAAPQPPGEEETPAEEVAPDEEED